MNNPRNPLAGGIRLAALFVVLSLFLSGCYWTAAKRYTDRTGTVPWWCQGSTDLTIGECLTFSANIDLAISAANQYPTEADAIAGNLPVSLPHGVAAATAYGLNVVSATFDAAAPNALLYDNATSQLAGLGWVVESNGVPPEGFAGSRDVWTATDGTLQSWYLNVWAIRGYENHPDIFATQQPCLDGLNTLTDTSSACFIASHTVPLDVMVTNDDGYSSPGIDALVEALTDDPNDPSDTFVAGVEVTVVAPLTQQSGQGDNTTPGGAPGATQGLTTASGYPVLAAVHGTPADTVIWALQNLQLSPDVVLSGINDGQNLANIGHLASGTVGAARTAMRRGRFDAIATSAQGGIADWPASAAATLALLEEWRLGRAGVPFMSVPNINIPSCNGGGTGHRGFLETVVGVDLSSGSYNGPTNCDPGTAKPAGSIVDDLDAYLNGFVGIADMGLNQPPNFP